MPTSVWGAPTGRTTEEVIVPNPASLSDIMSEQMAYEMNHEGETIETPADTKTEEEKESAASPSIDLPPTSSESTDNDLLLATMLQRQFDAEHDANLRAVEKHVNKNDKVQLSFEKYRVQHSYDRSDDEEEEEDFEDEDYREAATNLKYNTPKSRFHSSGLERRSDGRLMSKHDGELSAQNNTGRMMTGFNASIHTGDAMGMRLSNQVYNHLRKHSKTVERRRKRVKDRADQATAESCLDTRSRLILVKMVDGGLLRHIGGRFAGGKESVILHAYGCVDEGVKEEEEEDGEECETKAVSSSGKLSTVVPAECAIKIYQLNLTTFKNRLDYVKDDYRFRSVHKVVKLWADKERLNLNRLIRANIACPRVVKLKANVLVMEFIGKDGVAAPQLRHSALDDEQLADAFAQVMHIMVTMYRQCALVHADLSEFNLLYHEQKVYVIDVSQSVDTSHPRALTLLYLDCKHVLHFFQQQRHMSDAPTMREMFNKITDLSFESDDTLESDIGNYTLENRSVQARRDKTNPADCEVRRVQDDLDVLDLFESDDEADA